MGIPTRMITTESFVGDANDVLNLDTTFDHKAFESLDTSIDQGP